MHCNKKTTIVQCESATLYTMKRNKRRIVHAIASVIFLIILLYLFFSFPPTTALSLGSMKLSILIPVFLLLFLFLLSFITAIFKSYSHGLLTGTFVVVYLLLRINGLTHPLFLILLLGLFLTLELLMSKGKQ